jgi:broad specificity phosphatase PhoE
MTTRIILASHAPTAAQRTASFPGDESLDPPLVLRADAIATLEQMGPFDHLLAAPERRATETAAALLPGGQFAIDPALRDCNYGSWIGRSLAEVRNTEPDALAAWLTDPAANPHGGESLQALLARVAAWLEARAKSGGRILAVTHPAIIRAAIIHALGAPPNAFWRIDVEPLAYLDLRGGAERWSLRALGRFHH